MKIVIIRVNPWPAGTTATLARAFLEVEAEGLDTGLVELADPEMSTGPVCRGAVKPRCGVCAGGERQVGTWLYRMAESQGIISAFPVHHATITDELKAMVDRCDWLASLRRNLFECNVGGPPTGREGIQTFDVIDRFFSIHRMIVPAPPQWDIGVGEACGDLKHCREGRQQAKAELGCREASLIRRSTADSALPPWTEDA